MEKKIVFTENAPAAIGPYSQGVDTGSLVFTSGQLPINPADKKVIVDDIKAATRQCLLNCQAILEAAGTSLDKAIKTTVFLTDLKDFAGMNEVYAEFFTGDCPARATVGISELALGAKVEIDVIAIK
ncbi:MAG: RidA family protein [Clostridiales bacterium]|nr:RidA family protein [Clostridiales bacterium]